MFPSLPCLLPLSHRSLSHAHSFSFSFFFSESRRRRSIVEARPASILLHAMPALSLPSPRRLFFLFVRERSLVYREEDSPEPTAGRDGRRKEASSFTGAERATPPLLLSSPLFPAIFSIRHSIFLRGSHGRQAQQCHAKRYYSPCHCPTAHLSFFFLVDREVKVCRGRVFSVLFSGSRIFRLGIIIRG